MTRARAPESVSVAVFCEREGAIRNAFLARGFDAWSVDIEPAADGSNRHIRDDAAKVLQHRWDLVILAHPPCPYLCNSGVRWLYRDGRAANGRDPERWRQMEAAAAFYRMFRDAAHVPLRAIENPAMHRYAQELTGRGEGSQLQTVQPWWFGHPTFKATVWELFGLPPLARAGALTPPRPGTDEHRRWSVVHRMPPGPDRSRKRSATPPPMATAYAAQWGDAALCLEERP